jgi:hypothetical protein
VSVQQTQGVVRVVHEVDARARCGDGKPEQPAFAGTRVDRRVLAIELTVPSDPMNQGPLRASELAGKHSAQAKRAASPPRSPLGRDFGPRRSVRHAAPGRLAVPRVLSDMAPLHL